MDRETKNEITRDFAEFMRRAFLKFQEKAVSRGQGIPTQADFARYLGVDTTSLSNWMTATRPPTVENADAVASKLGLEVWDVLRLPPRMSTNKYLKRLAKLWAHLTEAQQRELAERADNFVGKEDDPQVDIAG